MSNVHKKETIQQTNIKHIVDILCFVFIILSNIYKYKTKLPNKHIFHIGTHIF